MTVETIYQKISEHMIYGIMLHNEFSTYYDYLSLDGYKRCHDYSFLAESFSHRAFLEYYINHHNRLIPKEEIKYESVIPESWYNHTRDDVDENTKRNAVRVGLNIWIDWERQTKKLYEESYSQLLELGEVASANKVHELICDVDYELKKAERYALNAETLSYDMLWIISEQRHLYDKYEKKIKHELLRK